MLATLGIAISITTIIINLMGSYILEKQMNKKSKSKKPDQKVWAVIDMRYGVVGLYATRRLAMKACNDGVGLDSGYAGSVLSMVVRQSVEA